MIQINVPITTKGGILIAEDSVLDVTPHFITKRIDIDGVISVDYDVTYDVDIYKSLSDYEANAPILVKAEIVEFNVGFAATNVNLLALDSVTALLNILKTAIEEGSEGYSGVGIGNTQVVYPFK